MKNSILLFSTACLAVFASCNSNTKTTETKDSVKKFTLENANCFKAISNTDTATLSFDQDGKHVIGEMSFNFKDKQSTNGTIKGEFSGDTLFVDYTFMLEGKEYKNPQVFLKEGDNYIQGSGELEVYVGRTYFKKSIPINYKNGFIFEPTECK